MKEDNFSIEKQDGSPLLLNYKL